MASIIYDILKPVVKLTLRLAYSKIESKSLSDALPKSGPVFIIANHQNALIDPLLICVESNRQISFLTRASAFKNPLVAAMLKQFNMLPVFRPRDSVDIRIANESVFEESIKRLCANGIIGIFPEGNHGGKRELRPLRKGYARMARMALSQDCDPFILPVGIDYSSHYSFNSRVVLRAGRGFYSSEIGDLSMDEQVFYNQMLVESRIRLIEVMVASNSHLSDSILWRLDRIFWNHEQLQSLTGRQELINRLGKMEEGQLELIKAKLKTYQNKLKEAGRNHQNLNNPRVGLLLLIPVFLGKTLLAPIQKLVRNAVEKLAEDPQFTATIAFAVYLIAIPFCLGILFLIGFLLFNGWIALLLSLLALIFILSYRWAGKKQWVLSSISETQLRDLNSKAEELKALLG